MPDFLGIGAQKAGTTWLHAQLARHPQLRLPAEKELHFWNRYYDRGIAWYQSCFPAAGEGERQGEITPAYGFLPVEKIQEIHALWPQLRMIYSVRDPVARAWSSARMALERAEMTLEEASDAWFIDHFTSQGSLARGDYETCMRNWLTVFPPAQFLLLEFEDIKNRPLALLHRCCEHLGVDAGFYNEASLPVMQEKVNRGNAAPIRPALKSFLQELYAEKTASFRRYLETISVNRLP